MTLRSLVPFVVLLLGSPLMAMAQEVASYRVLATSRTSTMQKEMQDAAAAGFRFVSVMGGETSFGGNEVVVLMEKTTGDTARFDYRLLATSRTSTMQRELQEAAEAGFEFIGQTVFESLFGGEEVTAILERDPSAPPAQKYEYPTARDEQDVDAAERTPGSGCARLSCGRDDRRSHSDGGWGGCRNHAPAAAVTSRSIASVRASFDTTSQ